MLEGLGHGLGFEPETWSVLDADLGYRMRHPRFVPPAPERVDLVLLGDSITYDMGMPAPGTVNLSGVGFGTDQELILLERHLADLKHVDRVVLNFCLFNDFIDNASAVNPHDGFRAKPYFTLEGDALTLHREHLRVSGWDRIMLWINQRSGAVFFLRTLLGVRQHVPSPSEPFRFRQYAESSSAEERQKYDTLRDTALPLTRRLLQRMARTVEDRLQARFAVLVFPSNYSSPDPLQMPEKLRGFFAGFDFPVEDLGCHVTLRGLAFRDLAYDRVGHLTNHGRQLAAEVISTLPGDPAAASPCRIKP